MWPKRTIVVVVYLFWSCVCLVLAHSDRMLKSFWHPRISIRTLLIRSYGSDPHAELGTVHKLRYTNVLFIRHYERIWPRYFLSHFLFPALPHIHFLLLTYLSQSVLYLCYLCFSNTFREYSLYVKVSNTIIRHVCREQDIELTWNYCCISQLLFSKWKETYSRRQCTERHCSSCIFSDANMSAYGARVCLSKQNQSALLMAKSRVPPLKRLALPGLELIAAVTGVRLSKTIGTAQIYVWSDS